jgi:hypothetical protein
MDPNEVNQPVTDPEGEKFLSDLLGDAKPGEGDPDRIEADPVPGEGLPADDGKKEQEPKTGDEKPPEDGVKPDPGPDGAAPKPPTEPKTWEYRGKQYTLEQMVELGVLDDVIQTARQFPTIQTKYQSLLEEKAVPAAPGAGEKQPVPQGPTGDQILQAYAPEMHKMATEGYIEPEAYEVFPKLVSALMFHRDLLYDVRTTVAAMLQNFNAASEVNQKETAINFVNGLCDKISGEGEHFTVLKDAKVRDGFYEYLGTLNVPIKAVTEDFVRKQWVAYNSGPMLEAVGLAARSGREADSKARRNAKGEGSGVRPAPSKSAPENADQELIKSFLE